MSSAEYKANEAKGDNVGMRRWIGDGKGDGGSGTSPLAAAATHLSSIKSAKRVRAAVVLSAIIFAIILSVITIASHPYPYPYRSE